MLSRARALLARSLQRASHTVSPRLQAASYRAARTDHWSGDWMTQSASVSQILRADLAMLREKSRDLVMNNATAARLPTLFSENISGKDGIQYQAAVKLPNGERDEVTNVALEESWYRWAEDPKCVTADRKLALSEVEQLLDTSECTDGETLVRFLPGFDNKYRFALQILDPDQLDINFNVDAKPSAGRNRIVMGIEVDEWGAPLFYHLWPNHPSEFTRRGERMKIPVEQIEHNFLTQRAGQLRGVPWLAAVMTDLMHLGKYREAEVIAARVSAAKMFFIQDKDGNGVGEQPEGAPAEFMDAAPGLGMRLRRGETVQEWNPLHPNGNYDAFDRAILRNIAGAVRVSYMSVSGDLSQTSYASGRMGWLGEKAVYQMLQERKKLRFNAPLLRAWLPMALVADQINVTRRNVEYLSPATWAAKVFPSADPMKDATTNAIDLALGKKTLTDILAEEGLDIREVFKKRKAELELARDMGIPLFLPVGAAIALDDQGNSTGLAPAAGTANSQPAKAVLSLTERVA